MLVLRWLPTGLFVASFVLLVATGISILAMILLLSVDVGAVGPRRSGGAALPDGASGTHGGASVAS